DPEELFPQGEPENPLTDQETVRQLAVDPLDAALPAPPQPDLHLEDAPAAPTTPKVPESPTPPPHLRSEQLVESSPSASTPA
ncbi:MAG: hypothetical protein KDE58_18095, partial [Caldilineaceae bacterium]|nr:hypothetical protein [Caldilineaceae bacterium]